MAKTKQERELAKKVRERENFIVKVVIFVSQIVAKRGKVVKREEHSAHTRIEEWLLNFEDFSFCVRSGLTLYGGSDITLIYHLGRKLADPGVYTPVLRVYWPYSVFSLKECSIQVFNKDLGWQDKMLHIIRYRKSLIRKLDRQVKEDEIRKAREIKESAKRIVLQHRAASLKISG